MWARKSLQDVYMHKMETYGRYGDDRAAWDELNAYLAGTGSPPWLFPIAGPFKILITSLKCRFCKFIFGSIIFLPVHR